MSSWCLVASTESDITYNINFNTTGNRWRFISYVFVASYYTNFLVRIPYVRIYGHIQDLPTVGDPLKVTLSHFLLLLEKFSTILPTEFLMNSSYYRFKPLIAYGLLEIAAKGSLEVTFLSFIVKFVMLTLTYCMLLKFCFGERISVLCVKDDLASHFPLCSLNSDKFFSVSVMFLSACGIILCTSDSWLSQYMYWV